MNLPYLLYSKFLFFLRALIYSVSFLVVLLGLRTVVLRVPVGFVLEDLLLVVLRGLRVPSECVPELEPVRGVRVPAGCVSVPPGLRVVLRLVVSSGV